MLTRIGGGGWLSALGVVLFLLGIFWSSRAIARNDPRHHAIVRTYSCHLCVGPDSVVILRPVDGAEPECHELNIIAQVDMIASVPINRPPSADKLAEAGPERAFLVTLIGSTVTEPLAFHDYFWQTGDSTPRQGPSGRPTQHVPEEVLHRVLPVLGGEMDALAGVEVGNAVRSGGVPASSLPVIKNPSNWPTYFGLAIAFVGIILIRVGWGAFRGSPRRGTF